MDRINQKAIHAYALKKRQAWKHRKDEEKKQDNEFTFGSDYAREKQKPLAYCPKPK
jgi:hypothetical protein